MVPYTASSSRSSPPSSSLSSSGQRQQRDSSTTVVSRPPPPPVPPLLALPASVRGEYFFSSPCSSSSSSPSTSSPSRHFFKCCSSSSPCSSNDSRAGATRSGGGGGGSIAKRVEIPLEVFPAVFQYMDASTLCSVSSVSKEWRRQGNDDQYWGRLCRTRFNVTPDAFAPPPDPIKRLYQLQYGSFKAMCRGCGYGSRFRSAAPPTISAHTSAQLLMGLMMSNAM
ncbi:unnamed protein product [Pylaiella littoralis]